MAKLKNKSEMTSREALMERNKKLEERDFSALIKQIELEYQLAFDHQSPKWDTWELRLKLYNNQKRDKDAVGDPLMFTIHQSVLASLYADRLTSSFEAREDGDEERCDQLNPMAEFDYDEMDKDILDYEWDWDATFFGVGYQLMMEFSSEHTVPMPEVLDPMTVLIDPSAKSTQGIGKESKGAAQFLGWESQATQRQLKDAGVFFNLKNLKNTQGSDPLRSRIDRNHEARNAAGGFEDIRNKSYNLIGDNKRYNVLNWFTWYRGKLRFVTLGESRTKVIRFETLERKTIPVVDRYIFPISHQLQGVSIPDLTEDKQRARSVMQNYALKTAKIGVIPRYIYNSNKIKNKRDLDVEFNKHIAVDGDPANSMIPVQTVQVKQDVQYIMDVLDTAAQRATATPEQQQGVPTAKRRTLGELQMVSQSVDTRYSLSARIFGWSEKRFWQEWYMLYKTYMADKIDEKAIRIYGAGGKSWKKLTRENIIADVDPDVKVEAKSIADERRLGEHQTFRQYVGDIINDPGANLRYALKELGKKAGIRSDVVDRLLPMNADELQAETENDALSRGEKMPVLPTDDDIVHLITHDSASDTPEKYAHMNAHKRAILLKKQKPEMFPEGSADRVESEGINPAEGRQLPGVRVPGTATQTGAPQRQIDLATE